MDSQWTVLPTQAARSSCRADLTVGMWQYGLQQASQSTTWSIFLHHIGKQQSASVHVTPIPARSMTHLSALLSQSKLPEELAVIRYCNEIGSAAHVELMRYAKPGMMEYQVHWFATAIAVSRHPTTGL